MEEKDYSRMIATANYVKDRLYRRGQAMRDDEPSKSKFGAMIGTMNKYLGGNDNRKIVFGWLFAGDFEAISEKSSKTLTNAQANALINWIEWWKDDEGAWHVGERFPHEALCVLNAALRAYNMANRAQKNAISPDGQWSLVNAMVDKGGLVTAITDDDLSIFDKEEDKNGK